ncbi:ATP-binding protein [Candidatus Dependentiae bacterium]|nr:ATP-binding protein [Candidatus Dependentiae bacterium]MBU4386918.1 ATP-binding protein [Candidatus Dependentiae bacterium]MCG2756395.1 ATP-binding protein [Candidatus Dependentiae bacterium]
MKKLICILSVICISVFIKNTFSMNKTSKFPESTSLNDLRSSLNPEDFTRTKNKKTKKTTLRRLKSSSSIFPKNEKKYIIILKGAPATGKSEVLNAIKDSFNSKKIDSEIIYVGETSTEIIKELQKKVGKKFKLADFLKEKENLYWFQTEIILRQLEKESQALKNGNIIILDRSLIDIKAYISIYFKDELKTINKIIKKQDIKLKNYEINFLEALKLLEDAISQKHENYRYLIIPFKSKEIKTNKKFDDPNRAETSTEEIKAIEKKINKKYEKYLIKNPEKDTEVSEELPYTEQKNPISKKRKRAQLEIGNFINKKT